MSNNLPLLNLFVQLREAGLPLSVDDYHAMLRSLQAGHGIYNRNALSQLCRNLWVKSLDEQRIFDYYFDLIIAPQDLPIPVSKTEPELPLPKTNHRLRNLASALIGIAVIACSVSVALNLSKSNSHSKSTQTTEIKSSPFSLRLPQTLEELVQEDISKFQIVFVGAFSSAIVAIVAVWLVSQITKQWMKKTNSIPKPTNKSSDFTISSEPIGDVAPSIEKNIVLQVMINKNITRSKYSPVSDEYFPITRRQMRQSWRHLRYLTNIGTLTDVDVAATVDQVGRQGIFLKPVLMAQQVNRTQLILLLDQGGSMIPFQALSSRLIETARKGGRLGQVVTFYFHNCPTEYSYQNAAYQNAQSLDQIFKSFHSERTVVLIVSDAGAARGQFNVARLDGTGKFLEQLKGKVRHIAWLNPMPRERWVDTTAEEIAHLVPMFELGRQGLRQAISLLRGRSPDFEARQ